MPIYEYKCQKCGHALEVMQKVSDPAPATCPSCGAESALERQVSRTSFQLKGGGWYSDLYGSSRGSAGTASSGGGGGSATSGGTASTPAAPAAPTSGSSGSGSSGSSGSGSTP